jgi:hypothetical protein
VAEDDELRTDRIVRVVTLICLTAIIIASIAGITVTAVLTERNVRPAEGLTFGATVLLALLGGLTIRQLRRHRRWRIERENGGE